MDGRHFKSTLCVIGVLVSCYAVYIEISKESDSDYEAWCDINEKASCSRVLTSEYSVGLGIVKSILGEDHILNISNAYYGIFVYIALCVAGKFLDIHIYMYP